LNVLWFFFEVEEITSPSMMTWVVASKGAPSKKSGFEVDETGFWNVFFVAGLEG